MTPSPEVSELEEALAVADELEKQFPKHFGVRLAREVRRLREEAKATEKVAEVAKRTWISLVPFSGNINTIPIPGIKSRCRVSDGRYTIPAISDELYNVLAAYDARAKQERP